MAEDYTEPLVGITAGEDRNAPKQVSSAQPEEMTRLEAAQRLAEATMRRTGFTAFFVLASLLVLAVTALPSLNREGTQIAPASFATFLGLVAVCQILSVLTAYKATVLVAAEKRAVRVRLQMQPKRRSFSGLAQESAEYVDRAPTGPEARHSGLELDEIDLDIPTFIKRRREAQESGEEG
ncbi:hypothetical protein EON79_06310 [bacterium]|nr:MAG: hypothetical protein EON79_06310 [bacterium]